MERRSHRERVALHSLNTASRQCWELNTHYSPSAVLCRYTSHDKMFAVFMGSKSLELIQSECVHQIMIECVLSLGVSLCGSQDMCDLLGLVG